MTVDAPRRAADLARGLADVLTGWWLGFDTTRAEKPPGGACPVCGAVVGDPDRHAAFHAEELDRPGGEQP